MNGAGPPQTADAAAQKAAALVVGECFGYFWPIRHIAAERVSGD
ncbi:MAG: hypothetical protein ACKVP5_08000 [Aestuariivirga sp.]